MTERITPKRDTTVGPMTEVSGAVREAVCGFCHKGNLAIDSTALLTVVRTQHPWSPFEYTVTGPYVLLPEAERALIVRAFAMALGEGAFEDHELQRVEEIQRKMAP